MNPILVALDVESAARAIELADLLRGAVGGYKIGNPKRFTLRLVRMLDRDYLADLDDQQFPTRATLTKVGLQLADF